MTARTVVAIGEAMVEFSRRDDGSWQQGFAGDTLNVLWAMRALLPVQAATVSYVTRVGGDALSARFRAFLDHAGIDTTLVGTEPDRTIGLYTIETDAEGERRFSYWRGQSAARRLADDPARVAAVLAQADLVYLSGISLAILPAERRQVLLDVLGQRGARRFTLAFDPNIRPTLWDSPAAMRDTVTAAAARADTVLPTFGDEALAFGDADPAATKARYLGLGVPEIIVKNGTEPTLFSTAQTEGEIAVAAPVRAVDTTGAGDSFNGAYLAARLLGHAAPDAVRIGHAASRAVVGQRGALLEMGTLAAACAEAMQPAG